MGNVYFLFVQIAYNGHYSGFSMQICSFRGGLDFLGPKMGPRFAQAHFKGPKKSLPPLKLQICMENPL